MFSTKVIKPSLIARAFLNASWQLIINSNDKRRVAIIIDESHFLDVMKISELNLEKGIIYNTVILRAGNNVFRLAGCSDSKVDKLKKALLTHINGHLEQLIENDLLNIPYVDELLASLIKSKYKYLSKSDIFSALKGADSPLTQAFTHPLFDVCLLPARITKILPESLTYISSEQKREEYNSDFVSTEKITYKSFFDNVGGNPLSEEQRDACIRLEDSNLLIACAGAGKTSTMVGKVAYVLDKGLYVADEILVMAYNRDAAQELGLRLAKELDVDIDDLKVKTSTFHALGLEIIKQTKTEPIKLANWVESPTGEAKFMDALLEKLAMSDSEFERDWVDLLTLYPEAEAQGKSDNKQENLKQTLDGLTVRSIEEQMIVNWLFLHSIPYEYEKPFKIEYGDGNGHWLPLDELKEQKYIFPDFYYPEIATWHEHFGVDDKGNAPAFLGASYQKITELKRDGFTRSDVSFFETTSGMNKKGTLLSELAKELTSRGLTLSRKSRKEILKSIDSTIVKKYHNLISICIKHIRSNKITLDMLVKRSETLTHPHRARVFSRVVIKLAEAYSKMLKEQNEMDFDDMITLATSLVDNRLYESKYRLILVDEFQDISLPRANFIKAIKGQNIHTKLFAVGDDFQSIYRFAGSDLTLFTRFTSSFGPSWQGKLQTTYRSNQLIAKTAAEFVQKNPEQISKTVDSIHKAIPKSLRAIPYVPYDESQNIEVCAETLLKRLNYFAQTNEPHWQANTKSKLSVLILARYTFVNPFKKRNLSYSHLNVDFKTFHGSKGLEADYVILLDVSEGKYGVPSQIQDDELLQLVIPHPETYPLAEERRLFYVAMTRASKAAYFIFHRDNPSRFLDELKLIARSDFQFENANGEKILTCPMCSNGSLIKRKSKYGKFFLGCSSYPKCDYIHRNGM